MPYSKLKQVGKLPKQYRDTEASVRVARESSETESALYEVAVSTEAEVERWYGVEVLSHARGAVDLSRLKRGAAVLVDHYGDQVGVVESARIDEDKVLRAEIRFSDSARGQEVERDVVRGIRRNISVGYFVKKAESAGARDDGMEVIKVTRWQPAEVSIVSVPADMNAGVGRTAEEYPVEIEDEPAMEERKMDEKVEVKTSAPAEVEALRAKGIRDLCAANGLNDRAQEYIASTLSVESVASRIIEMTKTSGPAQPAQEEVQRKMAREMRNYSVVRAIQRKVAEAEGTGKFDGLEAEVHAEIERNLPAEVKRNGGFLMPLHVRTTLDSLTLAKGSELVAEQPGQLIELLRPQSVAIESGVRVLTGLVGPIAFPKQTAGATVYWVPENPASAVADGEPSLGLSLMSPKTIQGNIPFTRQLLQQSSIGIEAWARDELSIGHGLAIDKAVFHGRGNNGEPTGVYAAAGVNAANMTNFAGIVNIAGGALMGMISTISDQNADIGTLGWVTTPLMAGKLRVNLEFSAAGASTIWQGPLRQGTMLGYTARTSTQVSKVMSSGASPQPTGGAIHGMMFGNWSDILLGLFGALEVVVDPYSNKKKGIIEVTTFQMADLLVRHGESFSKSYDSTLT
jgi:HK97 family phage major capsid protein/HK97 family phage prohead protease